MSTVQEIEEAVSRLSLEELATFREWFSQLDADAWDRQLQRDITAGRLNDLAQEALRDFHLGHCSNL